MVCWGGKDELQPCQLVDKQESFQPEALVMTASQEVEGIIQPGPSIPQVTFHIAAFDSQGDRN